MNYRRTSYYAFILLLLSAISISYADEQIYFEHPDFLATSRQATINNIPILVLFSATDCDYCMFVKEEFLAPMLRNNDYTDKVIIRVVDIDKSDYVRDFNGKMIFPDDLANRFDIQLTPTVAFLDAEGQELSDRVIGIGTVDYYGSSLDEAINNSQKIINLN